MSRLLVSLIAAGVAALALPPAAGALVQVDRGIAGVRLDNTRAEVRAALGTPASRHSGENPFGFFRRWTYRGGITVLFQGGRRVSSVSTTGLGDRTSRGVGVRSRLRAVRKRVPGVTCERLGGVRSCHTGDFLAGQRVTDFLIRRGRVMRVTVGFVID
jgi:hypothetical protein